jgi:hypothetical protein
MTGPVAYRTKAPSAVPPEFVPAGTAQLFLNRTTNVLTLQQEDGTLVPLTSFPPGAPAVAVKAIAFADSPYQVTAADNVLLVDTSGGAVTVTLEAAPIQGHEVSIKRTTTDANAITIAHNGHNIEGAAADLALNGGNTASVSLVNLVASGWWVV